MLQTRSLILMFNLSLISHDVYRRQGDVYCLASRSHQFLAINDRLRVTHKTLQGINEEASELIINEIP